MKKSTSLIALGILLCSQALPIVAYADSISQSENENKASVNTGVVSGSNQSTDALIEYWSDNQTVSTKRDLKNVTIANKDLVFEKKIVINPLATNTLFSMTFTVPTPGTTTINGDIYNATVNLTKKVNPYFRMTNVTPFIVNPNFYITSWGGPTVAQDNYVWDESIMAWRMPNPMHDVNANVIDTTTALNGTSGIKLYMTGDSTGFLPLSELRNDPTLEESRPVIFFDDVEKMSDNETSTAKFNIFQERLYSESGYWHNWGIGVLSSVTYDFDGTISGSNPEPQTGLTLGDTAQFSSTVTLDAPAMISADTVWQVSTDDGVTYTDIEESALNSNGEKELESTLSFEPTLQEHGNLYRLKITPNGATDSEPFYTESAVLTLDESHLNYSVDYELDGGVNHTDNPTTYKYGVGVVEIKDPTKAGYDFLGWYDSENQPIQAISKTDSGDKTLYAKWQKTENGSVNVHYLDEDGLEIADTVTLTGEVGERFETEQKEILGYSFKSIEGEASGNFKSDSQNISYIYTKDDEAVINPPEEKQDNDASGKKSEAKKTNSATDKNVQKLPVTGEENSISPLFMGIMLIVLGTSIFAYRKKVKTSSNNN
ncbi:MULTISPECIES: MucBP domain-containing protein [unclassified Lactococcus]|uniref:MucBP domain-containing protein n=1 Tax=unclassified Lactococcus TaxID=2643510 RepID=UPI0011C9C550|nr:MULTISPECIES: MucBP domain-containing protein [unclassified Lactococcus]MQW22368.1 LPXTG cell wall anchor domain-containing protein [Lactococcus sp. dk101]TXK45404.1 LPXTG cell wall anchor domain-containing protein [Lactococcus sp. dk310]TXK51737.1 LPXTG cell wall anchor domain-containing protein [Lactococcus sp. dk322]